MDFMYCITVRARASFYLALTEKLFKGIDNRDEGYLQAREALDKCWSWLAGEDVTADELYMYLENADDTGLMVFAYEVKDDPSKISIWNTMITSLMYIVWQAYRLEGKEYVPQTIEAVDETIIDYLMEYVKECQNYDENWIKLLESYLLKKYWTDNADEYGRPIEKLEVMMVIESV